MSNVDPILALFVPISSLLAAFSLLVLTASSYGAKQALGIRVILWMVSFSFAAAAVQHLITLILMPSPSTPNSASTLIAWTTICIRLVITGSVWTVLYLHYQKCYEQTGISAFRQDLSITTNKPVLQKSRESAHA